jgi:hypothetical protein
MILNITTQRMAQITVLWLTTILVSVFATIELLPAAKSCEVVYVAQDELMVLEQQRVKNEPLENRLLFFGKVDEAIKLATILPKAFERRNTKVIYAEGVISGTGVRSISREIHQKLINELSRESKGQMLSGEHNGQEAKINGRQGSGKGQK